jgi:hypothetical protein
VDIGVAQDANQSVHLFQVHTCVTVQREKILNGTDVKLLIRVAKSVAKRWEMVLAALILALFYAILGLVLFVRRRLNVNVRVVNPRSWLNVAQQMHCYVGSHVPSSFPVSYIPVKKHVILALAIHVSLLFNKFAFAVRAPGNCRAQSITRKKRSSPAN